MANAPPISSIAALSAIVPKAETLAHFEIPNLSVTYLNILGLSSSITSVSISPTSTLSSLANLENTVCHVSAFKSIMSNIYATLLPPTEPLAGPITMPFSLHHDKISDIDNIKPSMPIFVNTATSSSIAFLNDSICCDGIIPLSIFS